MALSHVALVGKPEAPWRYLIAVSMLGNLYTLLMSSDGDALSFLNASMCLSMRAQKGTSYRGFKDSVPLGPSRTSMCILRSVTLACNGIHHILVWVQNQPLRTPSSETTMRVVRLPYKLTSSLPQTDMYPDSANLAPLRRDCPARAGTMSTVCAGLRTGSCNLAMLDLEVWRPSATEKTLVDC